MKLVTFPRRVRYLIPSLMIWGLAMRAELSAVQVDSELVILVDVSSSVSNSEFSSILEGLASSFRSATVLDSISSGAIWFHCCFACVLFQSQSPRGGGLVA